MATRGPSRQRQLCKQVPLPTKVPPSLQVTLSTKVPQSIQVTLSTQVLRNRHKIPLRSRNMHPNFCLTYSQELGYNVSRPTLWLEIAGDEAENESPPSLQRELPIFVIFPTVLGHNTASLQHAPHHHLFNHKSSAKLIRLSLECLIDSADTLYNATVSGYRSEVDTRPTIRQNSSKTVSDYRSVTSVSNWSDNPLSGYWSDDPLRG